MQKTPGDGCFSYLLGVNILVLVPHKVLKSKMTTVRIIAVPFRVLRRFKSITGTN